MWNPKIYKKEEMDVEYSSIVDILRKAFSAYNNGNANMPEKTYVDIPKYNGDFCSMPAYIDCDEFEASGIKWVNVHPENKELPSVMGTVVYTDPTTGEPIAVLDGTELTKIRTAGAAALATDHLSKEDSSCLGIIGAGNQAEETVKAISEIRDINKVKVYDITDEKARSFEERVGLNNIDFEVVNSVEECQDCDILTSYTPVESPIVTNSDYFREHTHVNAMGADSPDKQEYSNDVIISIDNIFVDDWEQGIHSGEVSEHLNNQHIMEGDITETLGGLINSDTDFRDNLTLFDSTGLAIQDIATAHHIINKEE